MSRKVHSETESRWWLPAAGRDGEWGGTRNECRMSFGVMKTFFIYFRYSTVSVDTVWFGSKYKLIKYKPRHRACEEQSAVL